MTLAWTSDEYGTSNFHSEEGAHQYIQARPPYCDRGHWSLAHTGLVCPVTPSYYFFHLDVARAEAELALAAARGAPVEPKGLDCPEGWTDEGQSWSLTRPARKGTVTLVLKPGQKQGIPYWRLSIQQWLPHPSSPIDDADRFPRDYLDPRHAVAEAEAFLDWRLTMKPTAIPGPLRHEPIAIAAEVQKSLEGEKASPKTRKRPHP